ncbi:MAG TPA: WcaI family glycosyltransferase [Edaphobacter sp.]|nr:WcaI family glycosyltransferase [Edaphobacter sp.]
MKILVLGLNYLPESTSIGPYTAGLAEHLKASGHDVRVVTAFPAAPQWKVWSEYKGKRFMREVINGVPVLRTYLYVPKNPRKTSRRILFDCSFAVSALLGVVTRWRPDVVVAISPPLQLALTGLLIGKLTGAKVFVHIQDLVPDAAVAVGALRPGSKVLRVAQALENFIYRTADGIGVICEGMRRNLIAKGVPVEKVEMIPNYIDLSFAGPAFGSNGFRSKFGIGSDQFLAMYSGSVAGKQGLQTFVQAAAALKQDDGVTCCLIGEGPYLPELKQIAQGLSLQRFLFLPLQPREALASQLSAADVLVITQQKAVRDVVFPGKLLYYMAAGRAILASVSEDSETGRFIQENKVGLVVPPENPAGLAEALHWMRSHPDRTRELGLNGRRVVESQFDRTVVLDRFSAYLEGRPVDQYLTV